MRIAVLAESRPGERRVALLPEFVPRLRDAGFDVAVQPNAGVHAHAPDDAYREVGAEISSSAHVGADIVLAVQPPGPFIAGELADGAITVTLLATGQQLPLVRTLQHRGITAFSLDLVPRSSRAQPVDALSSQSMVAGYRSVIVAAERLEQFFPLLMTAAGTVRPANVLVLGAGVAGLQAVATARRLGAEVRAYDVRTSSAEEVRSLGAQFVELDLPPLEGQGGYAREMTPERAQRQRELLAPHVIAADALITTAAVPGKQAPMLVTSETVRQMKPGSVVVDMVSDSGGNVQGSRPGDEFIENEVLVWGGRNVPSQLPGPSSRLYSQNIVNLLFLMVDKAKPGSITLDFSDDIVDACCITHEGKLRVPVTGDLLGEVDQ